MTQKIVNPTEKQLKHEISVFKNQDQALDKIETGSATREDKVTLRNYFQTQINHRLELLNELATNTMDAAKVRDMEVNVEVL